MARFTSANQRILTGVTYPVSSYSRVVSCVAYIKAPGTARGFTPPLGLKLWLHGVDVWPSHDYSGVDGASLAFRITRGTGKTAMAGVVKQWQNVLPVFWPDGLSRDWSQYQPFYHMHWDMEQLCEGAAQRFGVWLEVSGFVPILEFVASFEISEG